jgi:Raf kinase inhibitor-like YbhB/YbcL family protein
MSFTLRSDAFNHGHSIPAHNTCDGQGLSPQLTWIDPPAGTRAFVLIVDDPDAPSGLFTHWIVCNIPPNIHTLPESTPGATAFPQGVVEGRNGFGDIGYGGPCPPKGNAHHYRFTLYALDAPIGVKHGVTKEQVLDAMRGHILDQTKLEGTYQRATGSPTFAAGGAAGRP